MTVLANNRRELFAQLLAQGFTEVDAHERAGYRRNDGNASTLAQHPEVQARLKEIKGKIAARAVVTAETLINEAEEARQAAMASGQFGAAVTAIKEKGVLSGKRVERSEVGGPGEYEALNDDELERQIMERVARLGLTDAGETQH
jgi:phage terminase small subunit